MRPLDTQGSCGVLESAGPSLRQCQVLPTAELFLQKVRVLHHFSFFQEVSSCAQLFNPGDFSGAVFCEGVSVLLFPYWWFWKTWGSDLGDVPQKQNVMFTFDHKEQASCLW